LVSDQRPLLPSLIIRQAGQVLIRFIIKSDHFTVCQCMISVFKKSAAKSQARSESYQAWSSLDARTDEV